MGRTAATVITAFALASGMGVAVMAVPSAPTSGATVATGDHVWPDVYKPRKAHCTKHAKRCVRHASASA
ncbi:hypothetical protein [Janibacter sp. GXQ6167]|uniref:hypothetical protein n=1 Tax=Janibacter sp. GXQ6167 TaxID=3240791 RepID=UPI00352645DE